MRCPRGVVRGEPAAVVAVGLIEQDHRPPTESNQVEVGVEGEWSVVDRDEPPAGAVDVVERGGRGSCLG